MSSSYLTSTASPILDKLYIFRRFCNPDDALQVQLMIKPGSDGFTSLIGEIYSQKGHISIVICYCPLFVLTLVSTMSSSSLTSTGA
ncbi:unnamed protein product [Schistocephalus solidus]|uniref:Ovule protein n=1 Tax=Schistocephalus solidus TaxID=70667 RepID=A0A183SBA6_SCHSO|nr:unnamed protein product [Schistocephalus solidus]